MLRCPIAGATHNRYKCRRHSEIHSASIRGGSADLKTFEDAIEVTRQIGIQYLWIDSLCIVQDDPEDFKTECSQISLTYALAYCVLSALGSENGNGGLFIPRSPLNRPTQIYLDEKVWNSMLRGPLKTRGWAFQEHQISQRTIHFNRIRILWECRTCVAYEGSPFQVSRAFITKTPSYYKNYTPTSQFGEWRIFDGRPERYDQEIWGRDKGSDNTGAAESYIYTRWLEAAQLYSSLDLTYNRDKLPAISGLAAATAVFINNDLYLAGLWRKDLIRGLLWKAAPSETGKIPDKLLYIPSWSWASHRGSITFLPLDKEPDNCMRDIKKSVILGDHATVTAYIDTFSQNPFVNANGGTLRIEARMKTFDIALYPDVSNFQVLDKNYAHVDVLLDNLSVPIYCGAVFVILIRGGPSGTTYGLVLKKTDSGKHQRLGVFFNRYGMNLDEFEMDIVDVE